MCNESMHTDPSGGVWHAKTGTLPSRWSTLNLTIVNLDRNALTGAGRLCAHHTYAIPCLPLYAACLTERGPWDPWKRRPVEGASLLPV